MSAPRSVQVFEYADEGAAKADETRIGPDAGLDSSVIDWVPPLHLFQSGRLVVLYVSSKSGMLDILTQLLEPQFAG